MAGATHTRYEHSLGCYALAQQTLQSLSRWYPTLDEQAALAFQLASLLHAIGHYAFAHCLEEIGPPLLSHEQVGRKVIEHSEIATFLESEYHLSPGRIADLVDPPKSRALPADEAWLASLLSGALDSDKLEYVSRDARACQVPYGYIEVSQLLVCLRVVQDVNGQPLVALDSKGTGALAALLHARQARSLTVSGHPQNRACQAMLRRAVQDALVQGTITAEQVTALEDEALLRVLADDDQPVCTQVLAQALARQHIYGEVLEISPAAHGFPALVALLEDTWPRRWVEQHLAGALRGLLERDIHDDEVLLDLPPHKSWEMDGWIWYDSPPIGCEELVPWRTALGLCSVEYQFFGYLTDRTVKLWNPRTGQFLRSLTGIDYSVSSISLSSDGSILASESPGDGSVWNTHTGQLLRTFSLNLNWLDSNYSVTSVALSADGLILACGCSNHIIKLLNVQTGKLLHTLKGHKGRVENMALSNDASIIASSCNTLDKTVKLWNVQTGKLLHTLKGHNEWSVQSIALSADGSIPRQWQWVCRDHQTLEYPHRSMPSYP